MLPAAGPGGVAADRPGMEELVGRRPQPGYRSTSSGVRVLTCPGILEKLGRYGFRLEPFQIAILALEQSKLRLLSDLFALGKRF